MLFLCKGIWFSLIGTPSSVRAHEIQKERTHRNINGPCERVPGLFQTHSVDGNEWWQLLTMENRLLMLVKWAVLGNGCKLGSVKQDGTEYIVFVRAPQSHHFNLWRQNMLSVCRRGTRFTLCFAVYCSVQLQGLKAECFILRFSLFFSSCLCHTSALLRLSEKARS